MDLAILASAVGMTTGSLSIAFQAFTALRRSNVELLAKKILETGVDLSLIGKKEELQRYFLTILDNASREANKEKIEHWKNAIVHLATDFADFQFKEVFVKILEDLTCFDLVVLHRLYQVHTMNLDKPNNQVNKNIESDVVGFFVAKKIPKEMVLQAMQRLFANGLVDESSTWGSFSVGKANRTGDEFLAFISANYSN